MQVARNLTDRVDGFLRGKRYLIHDRAPLFTDAFRAVLRAFGIECLKLPPRSPDLRTRRWRSPSGTSLSRHSDLIESTKRSATAFERLRT